MEKYIFMLLQILIFDILEKKCKGNREFRGGPVVRTHAFTAEDLV